jgi:hypothetical protein
LWYGFNYNALKMKRSTTLLIIISFFLVVSQYGCEDDNGSDKTTEELLIESQWRVVATIFNPPVSVLGEPLSEATMDCLKDDTYSFISNGTIAVEKGENDCDFEGNILPPGSQWFVNETDDTLSLHTSSDTIYFEVIEISPTTLKLVTRLTKSDFVKYSGVDTTDIQDLIIIDPNTKLVTTFRGS